MQLSGTPWHIPIIKLLRAASATGKQRQVRSSQFPTSGYSPSLSHQETPSTSQWAPNIAGDWWGWHRPGQTLRRGHILFVNDSRRGNDIPGAPNFIYTKARAPMQEDGPQPGLIHTHALLSACSEGEKTRFFDLRSTKGEGNKGGR